MYAQTHISSDDSGTDVQRRALGVRYPVLFNLQELSQTRHSQLDIELRYAQTVSRLVHAAEVVARTEGLDAAVGTAVCLQALEYRLAIVQNDARGIHAEILIGLNAGVVPAVFGIIVHYEHVIGEQTAKTQLALISRLGLQSLGGDKLYIVHCNDLLSCVVNQRMA